MHRCKEIHVGASVLTTFLSSYLANMSLQYKLLGTRTMYTQRAIFLFLKENVCSGYSLVAALSNVNDSFTRSRSIKRPKHFVIRHVMSTQNLYFFVKYTESVSTIRRRTPTLFKCYSLIFDRIRVLKFSNYSRRSCEQCRL